MSQLRSLLLVASLLSIPCVATVAQSATSAGAVVQSAPSTRQFETRAQIVEQIRSAERLGRQSEAWLLKARLERGDFQEGDRIVVVLEGSTVVMDTLQVRSGKLIQFPRMGELSLAGVLRSELADTVRHHLARYLTSPVVRVTPLLPLAVSGNVSYPGFYYTPADVMLRDVLMRAGGPLRDADINKMVIRRSGEVIWSARDVRVALSDGMSLDALHLRAGDEIVVPQQRRLASATIIAFMSSGLALTMAIVNLSR